MAGLRLFAGSVFITHFVTVVAVENFPQVVRQQIPHKNLSNCILGQVQASLRCVCVCVKPLRGFSLCCEDILVN